ncbi:hypothetical protein [Hyalangium rubrum]|uniref:Outer membrane protein beta-barrel domain-containing protein n=1 Tax=Hyalangium rubrum TaxID=3103134 RepID=A0ABU5HHQ9_9BACT|nr:hypothetical protein [Hyalangium sp. s54d21]MDY7232998.1 hypothetical protein [Hyalangium sp. s54d21]
MRPLICFLLLWPVLASAGGGSRGSGQPAVALTLGLSAGAVFARGNEYLGDDEGMGLVGGWIGVTLHPRPDTASLFLAAGMEINGVFAPDDGRLISMEYVPEVRGGLALLGEPFWEFFPYLELYMLGGFRAPNSIRGSALRVGAGLAIPAFGAVQFESLSRNCPPLIPWMIELVHDVSDVSETSLRIGYQF